MRQSILAGIKGKALLTVFVFVSVFYASSCKAYSYCNDTYPRARIVQNNDGSAAYTLLANGSGFSTYEVQTNSGIIASGGFASGQTINGNFMGSAAREYVYFRIRDAKGKVINGCETRIATLPQQFRPACGSGSGQFFQGGETAMGGFKTMWGSNRYFYFGGPSCLAGAPAILNYLATSAHYGVIFSGPVTYGQSVYFAYNSAYFKYPIDHDAFGSYDSYCYSYSNWALKSGCASMGSHEPPVNANFQIIPPAEGMLIGKNIQFNASAANIYTRVPDDYLWQLDGVNYRQGEDKSIIFANFPTAGTHTLTLTIREGRGNSGSSSQIFNVAIPPAPPACNATFSAPASAYYDQNIVFDPTASSNSGESDIVYKWSIDGTFSTQTGFSSPIFNRSFGSSNGPDVDIKLDVEHSNGSRCSFSRTVGLSTVPPPPPLPCTVNFDVRNSTKSCLTSSCNYNEPLTFSASAFVNPGSINGYTWTMSNTGGGKEKFNGNINTGASVSKTFVPADGKSHNIHLVARDSNGNTCTMDKTINLKPSLPGWNEIAPYLLQLGPIGLLALLFLARMISSRL